MLTINPAGNLPCMEAPDYLGLGPVALSILETDQDLDSEIIGFAGCPAGITATAVGRLRSNCFMFRRFHI